MWERKYTAHADTKTKRGCTDTDLHILTHRFIVMNRQKRLTRIETAPMSCIHLSAPEKTDLQYPLLVFTAHQLFILSYPWWLFTSYRENDRGT